MQHPRRAPRGAHLVRNAGARGYRHPPRLRSRRDLVPRPRTTHYVDRLANRLLAALMGAVSLMLLLGYLSNHFGLHGHPHFLALASPLPFSFGPLLYLYIAALTRQLPHFLRDAVAYGR